MTGRRSIVACAVSLAFAVTGCASLVQVEIRGGPNNAALSGVDVEIRSGPLSVPLGVEQFKYSATTNADGIAVIKMSSDDLAEADVLFGVNLDERRWVAPVADLDQWHKLYDEDGYYTAVAGRVSVDRERRRFLQHPDSPFEVRLTYWGQKRSCP